MILDIINIDVINKYYRRNFNNDDNKFREDLLKKIKKIMLSKNKNVLEK